MRSAAFLLMTALPAVAAPQVSIELLPGANVPEGAVVLGQVAHLRSTDLDLMRKLVHLPVGRAPAPGNAAVLQRNALAQWIRQRTGLAADVVGWSGAEESRVTGVAAQLAGEEIARAAVRAAREQLAATGRKGDVQARLVPRDVPLPSGEWRLEVRGLDQASWPRRMVLWVDVWAGGWFVRTVPVGMEWIAGDVREDAGMPDMPLASAADRAALRERGAASPGVMRGDWAVLRSGEGAVTLESRVEVLQDGSPGQKVRVRQQGAGGPLLARVVGRGVLELAP